MKKIDMKSEEIVEDNIEYIKEKFPNVVVESENGYAIDFNTLKQELSNVIVDDTKEKYQLTWPGKKEAIVTANTPTTKTLRPVREKSVNFDTTENIYIEGDNLEALKILQESYLGKIKCIYIDPPYNTGNDFIYKDNFNKDTNQELLDSGQIDEEGNRLVANNQSNGRYHSDWLSMMYPRLKLARNLLSEDGVIFISIDDHELFNLKKVCDEIFGENNFISNIVVESGGAFGAKTTHKNKTIFKVKDYVLVYCKNNESNAERKPLYDRATEPFDPRYNFYIDDNKIFSLIDYFKSNEEISSYFNKYNLAIDKKNISKLMLICDEFREMMIEKLSKNIYKDSQFTLSLPKNIDEMFNDHLICNYKNYKLFKTQNGKIRHLQSYYESLKLNDEINPTFERSILRGDLWKNFVKDMGNVGKEGNIEFKNGKKPIRLIEQLVKWANFSDGYILDFFSGSATTAHAIMDYNIKNNSHLKYILVQIPEETKESTYRNLCNLAQERIKNSIKELKKNINKTVDYGFRVYKIDSSNMKDVYYKPSDLSQEQLNMFETNIKDDRTSGDLLTQVILDLGLTLDLKIEKKDILNNKVYFVDENSLIACFDDNIDINIINEICKFAPLKVVFKDSSFKNDNDKINVEERIKKLSPETEVSIL